MKRAIVVTILVALVVVFVAMLVNGGQASGPRRPVPETKRHAPGWTGDTGYAPGTESPPESTQPADE